MGRYSTNIESPFDTKTFDDIKRTYNWIYEIGEKLELSEYSISSDFLYTIGDIGCTSESFDEFVEEAYGQQIDLTNVSIYIYIVEKIKLHMLV